MNGGIEIKAYPMDETSIIVGENILALCQSVKERTDNGYEEVFSFGEALPTGFISTGKSYELEISHIPANDGVSFLDEEGFTLRLVRRGKRTDYVNCVCVKCETERPSGEPACEKVTVRARKRRDV